MNEIVEWLRAQLDEDERGALAAGGEWGNGLPATIHPDPTVYRTVTRGLGHVCGSILAADAEHIARHDPARVLAEVAAKRRIIDRLDRLHEMHQGAHECPGTDDNCGWWPVGDCPTLWEVLAEVRDLASAYADRPGYQEEWRP